MFIPRYWGFHFNANFYSLSCCCCFFLFILLIVLHSLIWIRPTLCSLATIALTTLFLSLLFECTLNLQSALQCLYFRIIHYKSGINIKLQFICLFKRSALAKNAADAEYEKNFASKKFSMLWRFIFPVLFSKKNQVKIYWKMWFST